MNSRKSTQPIPDNNISSFRNKFGSPSLKLLVLLAAGALSGNLAQAANILGNAGFETTPIFSAWSAHSSETWSMNAASGQGKLYRTGANALWTQGLYLNGGIAPYYNMYAFQKIAAAPGATFSADAWFSEYTYAQFAQGGDNGTFPSLGYASGLLTTDASGVEDCWVEVQFLDSANNILADYKSAIISPIDATLPGSAGVKTINVYNWPTLTNGAGNIYLSWIDCQVTNQFDISTIGPNTDPATESVTNTLSNGIMTAPPGTAYVQYMLCLAQAQYESGANYWDDCALNQLGGPSPSVISGLTPNGTQFFNTNTSLTFSITSASSGGAPLPTNPANGIQIVVNGTDQSANLQLSGTPTAWNATLPNLVSNSTYSVSITVSNSAGLITTASSAFDTFQPSYIVPVETYDYNSGAFIQNPIPTTTADPNSYFGRAGVLGTDMSTYDGTGVLPAGPSTLAPNYPNRTDGNVAFEVSSDIQLPLYTAQNNPGVYNVDLSYNNPGNWFNYTRNPYPSGSQAVYARISGGQGVGTEYLNLVTSGYGTPSQTTQNLGQFYLANGVDWGHYYWIPLTDVDGNLVAVNLPAGQQTLQLESSPVAGENVISFIFVPFPSSGVPPSISNINPANGTVFATGSTFSFTATPAASTTINNNGIHLILNGADVTSSLLISGSTAKNVSFPLLASNTIYTAVINVTNSTGVGVSRTVQFDTISTANFYVKIADFDHDGGQWDTAGNGLTPASYAGQNNNITNVDYYHSDTGGGNFPYRGPDSLATENTSDLPLPGYISGPGGNDYDVGYFNLNDWGNYTRNYPPGKYLVYGRLAGGNGTAKAYLDQVTSGWGTTSQTLQRLGSWSAVPGGWQNWVWVPLLNNGESAVVSVSGTNTLRVTSGNNVNANYFMLVGVQPITISAKASGSNVVISFPTQAGKSYSIYAKASLTTAGWTLLSTVGGDGTVKSVSTPQTGGQQFYQVTSP